MRIEVDMILCQSHGSCVYAAPPVFELDENDHLHYLDRPDPVLREQVMDAADVCPTGAINVIDE
jgi:ferredoxin